MRIRLVPMRGFGSFGSTSPLTQADCPIGGSWESWCDCMWPADRDAAMNERCRSKPFPLGLTSAPWTEVGAAARGLPKPGSAVASVTGAVLSIGAQVTGGIIQAPPASASPSQAAVASGGQNVNIVAPPMPTPATAEVAEAGLFGVPKTAALVGVGVLGLGIAALVLTRRK